MIYALSDPLNVDEATGLSRAVTAINRMGVSTLSRPGGNLQQGAQLAAFLRHERSVRIQVRNGIENLRFRAKNRSGIRGISRVFHCQAMKFGATQREEPRFPRGFFRFGASRILSVAALLSRAVSDLPGASNGASASIVTT